MLSTIARKVGDFRYDAAKGRFRGWLKTVVRSRVSDFVRSQQRHEKGSGDTGVHLAIQSIEKPDNEDELWELEFRRNAFNWAIARIKSEFREATWLAFWKTSVEGQSSKQTADDLEMSVGAVYIARSRVLARLREVAPQYEEASQL